MNTQRCPHPHPAPRSTKNTLFIHSLHTHDPSFCHSFPSSFHVHAHTEHAHTQHIHTKHAHTTHAYTHNARTQTTHTHTAHNPISIGLPALPGLVCGLVFERQGASGNCPGCGVGVGQHDAVRRSQECNPESACSCGVAALCCCAWHRLTTLTP